MSDDDAYMALALNNAQGELNELEVGLHALGSPLKQEDYGKQLSLSQPSIAYRVHAARVAEHCNITRVINPDLWRHLAELHASPKWLWRSLVSRLVSEGWTVEQARGGGARQPDRRRAPSVSLQVLVPLVERLPDLDQFPAGVIEDFYHESDLLRSETPQFVVVYRHALDNQPGGPLARYVGDVLWEFVRHGFALPSVSLR